jgi:phosphotransacetylase
VVGPVGSDPGSSLTLHAVKAKQAVAMLREIAPDLVVDGEMQADTWRRSPCSTRS